MKDWFFSLLTGTLIGVFPILRPEITNVAPLGSELKLSCCSVPVLIVAQLLIKDMKTTKEFVFIQGLILIFILVHDILIGGVIFTKSEYIAMRFLKYVKDHRWDHSL